MALLDVVLRDPDATPTDAVLSTSVPTVDDTSIVITLDNSIAVSVAAAVVPTSDVFGGTTLPQAVTVSPLDVTLFAPTDPDVTLGGSGESRSTLTDVVLVSTLGIPSAPDGAQSLTGAFIASGQQVRASTVTTGPVGLLLDWIGETALLWAASLALCVSGANIPAPTEMERPILFAPTVAPQAVGLVGATITSGEVLYAVLVENSGGPQFLIGTYAVGTGKLYAPTAEAQPVTVVGPTLPVGTQVYAPVVVPQAVGLVGAFVTNAGGVYTPSVVPAVDITIDGPTVIVGSSTFPPRVKRILMALDIVWTDGTLTSATCQAEELVAASAWTERIVQACIDNEELTGQLTDEVLLKAYYG